MNRRVRFDFYRGPNKTRYLFEVSNDRKVRVVSKRNDLFVDHKSEDTSHGGTSVVEFDGTLGELGLFIEVIPSEVNVSVSEVTDEFVSGSWNILHETNFKESNKGNKLDKSSGRDGVRSEKGGNSVRVGAEGISLKVDASRKEDSGTGGDLSKEGKHTNTSVLDFDVSESLESLLVDISVEKSKRIEESKWRLGTKFILEGLDGGGGGLLLDRSEGGGSGDKGGEDSGFHFEVCILDKIRNCEKGETDRQSAVFRVASVENRENNSSKILDGEGFSVEEKEDSSTANARRIPDTRIWRESLRLTRVKADGFYQSYAAFLVICRRKQCEDPNRRRNRFEKLSLDWS